MDGAPHALLVLAPDRLELDPGRRDVPGAKRTEIEAPRAVAAVRDQIDVQEARSRVIPVGEGAHRDLVAPQMTRPRERGPAQRKLPPRRGQYARQGRPPDPPQEFLDLVRD